MIKISKYTCILLTIIIIYPLQSNSQGNLLVSLSYSPATSKLEGIIHKATGLRKYGLFGRSGSPIMASTELCRLLDTGYLTQASSMVAMTKAVVSITIDGNASLNQPPPNLAKTSCDL